MSTYANWRVTFEEEKKKLTILGDTVPMHFIHFVRYRSRNTAFVSKKLLTVVFRILELFCTLESIS